MAGVLARRAVGWGASQGGRRVCVQRRTTAGLAPLQNRIAALEKEVKELTAEKAKLTDKFDTMARVKLLHDQIQWYASKEMTPLNLSEILEYCQSSDYKTHLFLHRELPIRTAIAIQQLDNMPHGFTTMKSARLVKEWLLEEFELLTAAKRPDNKEQEEAYTKLLRSIHRKYQDSIIMLGKGLAELKHDLLGGKVKIRDKEKELDRMNEILLTEYPHLQEALDRYYAGRISAGFLIRQHIAIASARQRKVPRKGSEDYIGLVCGKTDLLQVCKGAIEEAEGVCTEAYGTYPKIVLQRTSAGPGVKIAHIPAHLHYIIFELLKNSLRATVEKYAVKKHLANMTVQYDCTACPPVVVSICDSDNLEDISIRISDRGGGIPVENQEKVMLYMYTTAKVSQFELMIEEDNGRTSVRPRVTPTPLAGFGYGLPISRLYAQHFDGDLRLVSMEGSGTDAYLHLGRSLQSTFESHVARSRRQSRREEAMQRSMFKRLPTSLDIPGASYLDSARLP
eukprot:TRINITY_DN27836_c0_g1_i1.p1 TRINITY_DN27836_c0_g1~~TRINITY_DN27836_c0_g1_i1.p1  ORF type:complete len:508 (+),score=184.42 TRINITY_DN27836_c0_g1_i1:72-1595(+)